MKAKPAGFTRIELMALVAASAMVLALALPLMAGTSASAARISCFNNLRQLGNAVLLFSNNHEDLPPWLTLVTNGGTRTFSVKYAAAWTELIVLSNDLATPRLLACPSDADTQVASHWGSTAGGLANSGLRANAVSYILSFHGQTELARSVVSGDRDFSPSVFPPFSCSRGVNNTAVLYKGDQQIAWTNEVHLGAGHLLFMDGTVEYMNSARLRTVVAGEETQNDSSSIHYINTR